MERSTHKLKAKRSTANDLSLDLLHALPEERRDGLGVVVDWRSGAVHEVSRGGDALCERGHEG